MKTNSFFIAAALLFGAAFTGEAIAQETNARIAQAYKSSAFELFNAVASEDGQAENICFSPLSLQIALAMAQSGADGNTLKQLKAAIGTENFSNEEIGLFNKQLTQTLTSRPPFNEENWTFFGDDAMENYNSAYPICELANSLWWRPDVRIYNDYIQTLSDWYDAAADSVSFYELWGIRRINEWASEHTHGLIPELFKKPLSAETAAMLANALYFKGGWKLPFDEAATAKGRFMTGENTYVDVKMMCNSESYRTSNTKNFRTVTLCFGQDGKYTMSFFVPLEGTALPPLTSEDWETALKTNQYKYLNLYLPRFETSGNYNLVKLLENMGVTDAFNPFVADFSKMSDNPLFISDVFQMSNIKVNETGTEAAAVTVIIYDEAYIDPEECTDFKVDRPFYFTIQSKDAILFVGRMKEFKDEEEHIVEPEETTYRPLVERGKVWRTVAGTIDSDEEHYYEYRLQDDVVIGGKTCTRLGRSELVMNSGGIFSPVDTVYVGALYEEDGIVYRADPSTNAFTVLYDFKSPVGTKINIDNTPLIIATKHQSEDTRYKGVCTTVIRDGLAIGFTWFEGVGCASNPMNSLKDFVYTDYYSYEYLFFCSVGDEVLYFYNYLYNIIKEQTGNNNDVKKQWLDFTHTVKPRPKAPRRSESVEAGEEEESLTGEYSARELFVNLKTLDGAYTVTMRNSQSEEVYRKEVQTSNIVALSTDLTKYAKGTYTLVIENDAESYTATLTIGDEDGITSPMANAKEPMFNVQWLMFNGIYDLTGRRLTSRPAKGLYIENQKLKVR